MKIQLPKHKIQGPMAKKEREDKLMWHERERLKKE
jgi:hypothetical protein